MTETYCPICGCECRAHPDSDTGICPGDCGRLVVPVPFDELDDELKAEYE